MFSHQTPTLPMLLDASPSTAIELSTPEGLHRLLTFAELRERAAAVAAQLRRFGVGPGDRVAILLPASIELLSAVFGAWMLGAVTLILPPLGRALSQLDRRTALWAVDSAHPKLIIAADESWAVLDARSVAARALDARDLRRPMFASGIGALQSRDPDQIAHLALSSGRTGRLRLCSFTHAQLIDRALAVAERIGAGARDNVVSSLPLDQSFGFFTGLICPITWQTRLRLIAPSLIDADPSFLLAAIGETQATITPLCAATIAALIERPIDRRLSRGVLSRWRYAWCSRCPSFEPLMQELEERLAQYGASRALFRPAFTVTEGGGPITMVPSGCERSVIDLGPRGLVAGAGTLLPGVSLRITDLQGRTLQEEEEGRIFFRADGLGGAEIDRHTRSPSWLDSGDLGFVSGGELFITGRAKALTERAGKKVHLDYVELAARLVPGVGEDGVAAVTRLDHAAGREELVLAVEAAPSFVSGHLAKHVATICTAIAGATGVRVDRVEAVRSGVLSSVPRGAPRRRAARTLLGFESIEEEAA